MKSEISKLQWAKMIMDHLAVGVDPISNTDADADTLHKEQVILCFRYVSDVLSKEIYEAEMHLSKSAHFYISGEQIAELRTYSYNCKVSELANEINRVTEENDTKKFSATWINDWLEAEGYLRKSDLKSRVTTEKGERLGITSEYQKRDNGDEYYINFFSEQAQLFVFHHINDILSYRNENKVINEANVHCIEYPDGSSIKGFIQQHRDKCFIMSIGSCDSVAGVGSYIAVLYYKGKSKVLKKTNIPTSSANKCILTGLIDAAASIKTPTDVIILSSTPLGFNTPKSKNYKFCEKIYTILSEKECNIYVAVCQGKGYELNSFVKSIH